MSHAEMPRLPEPFLAALRSQFPADFFSLDPDELRAFGSDWSKKYPPNPSAVAWPRSTREVSQLLALCHAHDVKVVPSGGRTGLAGGAVARDGELVLSLSRMRQMQPVDELGMTVTVEAGAITEAVHQHVEACGLSWPIDFASKGSSQIGGNLSTNAGGVKVIRYGLTRQWVLGLEVVLADGTVLQLGGALEKNQTGPDLRQLFLGSEGTLGVITAATLKLTRAPRDHDVFLFALRGSDPHADALANVLQLFSAARRGPFTVSAFEFFTHACLKRLIRHRPRRLPFTDAHAAYVLLEVEDPGRSACGERSAALEEWLQQQLEGPAVADATLAQHSGEARELWALREGISESLSATGLPHKNDISLPIAALQAFTSELGAVFAAQYPDLEICLFGHIGDGNLHVNVMKPDAMTPEAFYARTQQADHTMFQLVQKHRGSISAEHGIGLLKKEFLPYSRSAEELTLLRGLKQLLDPKGLLNPGKIL